MIVAIGRRGSRALRSRHARECLDEGRHFSLLGLGLLCPAARCRLSTNSSPTPPPLHLALLPTHLSVFHPFVPSPARSHLESKSASLSHPPSPSLVENERSAHLTDLRSTSCFPPPSKSTSILQPTYFDSVFPVVPFELLRCLSQVERSLSRWRDRPHSILYPVFGRLHLPSSDSFAKLFIRFNPSSVITGDTSGSFWGPRSTESILSKLQGRFALKNSLTCD